jgi:uncharacterized membrane protein YcaP (DUF421 family)
VKDGKVLQTARKELRLSVEDLLNSLRQKGYFDLNDVAYCIVETDGKISVFPTQKATPVTAEMIGKAKSEKGIPCVLVADGQMQKQSLSLCSMTEKDIEKILKKEKTPLKDVFILTADKTSNYTLIRKEQTS